MRPFEWIFILSFIPVLLLPAIPQIGRRRWLIGSALLPVILGVIQIVVEGWRIQIVPLYILAVLVLVSRIPAIRRPERVIRRRRGLLVSLVNALTLIASGVFAGWLLPVIVLPQPTGPYPVGIVDRQLVDEARGRKLMVSVWYPAAQSGAPAPLTHYPDQIATAIGSYAGLPGLALQHLRYMTVAASEDVPVLAEAKPFPVLVYSIALVGGRLQNSPTMQELASWGYVVVAIDHTDGAAVTVFPDGEVRPYDLTRFGVPADAHLDSTVINEHILPVWVADQRFVYDTLEKWQADDVLLAGKLDLVRIASFGQSFGGATAVEVCRVDERCRASIDLDGTLFGDSATLPAVRPVMLITSGHSSQYEEALERSPALISSAKESLYWLELPNSDHLSFTIIQLLSPILPPSGFDPRVGEMTIDKYVRLFFDIHLRGADPKLLQPSPTVTDVRWLSH